MRAYIWPGFHRPSVADYDREHLDQKSRDLIDKIVASLPVEERPNVRWLPDSEGVAVFEVTLAQFCPGGNGVRSSPIINERRRYVDPRDGEFLTTPPDIP
jgi:hypothetical protein